MSEAGLTRRAFFGRAVAVGAAASVGAVALAQPAGAADQAETFLLDPVGGGSSCKGGNGRGTCAACRACRAHAANKIFETKEAADKFRAHPGCRCSITAGPPLEPDVAKAVFAKGEAADRRDPETGGLLGSNGGVNLPVMTATLPVLVIGGGAIGYWLMKRHDRNKLAAQPDVDRGDWK